MIVIAFIVIVVLLGAAFYLAACRHSGLEQWEIEQERFVRDRGVSGTDPR